MLQFDVDSTELEIFIIRVYMPYLKLILSFIKYRILTCVMKYTFQLITHDLLIAILITNIKAS